MRTLFKVSILALGGLLLSHYLISAVVQNCMSDNKEELSGAYTCLVLGAFVYQEHPGTILKDRLNHGVELYKAGKVQRFLLSGDHGQKEYNEVNAMKLYLKSKGIPESAIFLDHAGFDTYNSIVRARDVFQVKDLIVVTQEFHLPRAVFIARMKGLEVQGYVADGLSRRFVKLKVRELFAGVKAWFEILINRTPRYLGEPIPIWGDSSKSYD